MFAAKQLLTRFMGYEAPERIRDGLYLAARYSGLGALMSRTRARGAAILVYHSVGGSGVFPDNVLETAAFQRHLELLTATRSVVPLRAIVDALLGSRELPEHWVALTFDDGYRDFATTVVPLLERYRVPATLFVPSIVLSQNALLFPDRLAVLLAATPLRRLDLRLNGDPLRLPLVTEKDRREAALRIALAVRTWDPERQNEWLEGFARVCEVASSPSPRLYVDEGDLAALARHELVEIGSHTVSHPNLGALPEAAARAEVEDSRTHLAEVCGTAVTSFAYPFGKVWSFNETTKQCLRRAGYRCALSTLPGFVHAGTDPFAIPRIGARASLSRLELELRGVRI